MKIHTENWDTHTCTHTGIVQALHTVYVYISSIFSFNHFFKYKLDENIIPFLQQNVIWMQQILIKKIFYLFLIHQWRYHVVCQTSKKNEFETV
jgi:hypothetical protein